MTWSVFTRSLLSAAIVAALSTTLLRAQPSLDAPQNDPMTADAPAQRGLKDIQRDLQSTSIQLNKALPPLRALVDASTRQKAAPAAVPLMWKMLGLFDEVVTVAPQAKASLHLTRIQFLGILDLLDDAKASKAIADDVASKDPAKVSEGQTAQAIAEWIKSSGDADSQRKILDGLETTVKANPTSEDPVLALTIMSQVGAAKPELKKRAMTIVLTDSQSATAKAIKSRAAAQAHQNEAVNQPMTIAGKTIDNKDFSTADWKGKVVLVDFWATWCGPCKAGLPEVKKLYADNHAKGLEIIGVSSDRNPDDLKDFLAGNPDMPWPQLYEPNTTHHPLLDKYGIEGIPTMYLIDRNGICRSVTAREDMQELVPKLLAEKAGEKPAEAIKQ